MHRAIIKGELRFRKHIAYKMVEGISVLMIFTIHTIVLYQMITSCFVVLPTDITSCMLALNFKRSFYHHVVYK
jgi:hypothetical protein